MSVKYFKTSMLVLFFTAACTQQPAQVEFKGGQSYNRGSQYKYSSSSSSSYSSGSSYSNSTPNTPVSENTEQSAAVDSIGISDLSPPTASADKPQIKSEPVAAPAASTENKDKSSGKLKTTVNPWTNKPRSDNEPKEATKQEAKIDTSSEKVEAVKPEETAEEKTSPPPQETKKTAPKASTSSAELKWPVASKKIISSFGSKGEGKANDGINIAAKNGDPVWSSADGEVVYVSNELKGFGNMVFIKHKGGKTTSYAHLGRVVVDKYDRVKQGDVIGYVGTTGGIKTPQLFFSLHKGKEAIDPQKYLSSEMAGL